MTIVGAPGPMLETRKLKEPGEFDVESFQAAPAIFQEYIPGERHLRRRVRAVLDTLGLEMGVIDLKLTPDGTLVWLEVNPQGQFLFLDALTHLGLTDRFAAYLLSQDRVMV